VHVVRHYQCNVEIYGAVVIVGAAVEHDLLGAIWQDPFFVGTESDEMRAIVTLKMRQLSAVKSFSHYSTLANVGTAALGCPGDCRWQT
jgi:hypothetical protein